MTKVTVFGTDNEGNEIEQVVALKGIEPVEVPGICWPPLRVSTDTLPLTEGVVLVWTGTTPTEPGFYYYHPPGHAPEHIWIAQAGYLSDRSKGLYCSTADFVRGPTKSHKPIRRFHGMWAGPIPNPGPCRVRE